MEETLKLTLPKEWNELSDYDLRYFYEIVASQLFSPVQARCTFTMHCIDAKSESYDEEKKESLLRLRKTFHSCK